LLPAAVLAVAYLIVAPSPADLAAQTFRADLFSAHGFLVWNDYWYSGHSLPGYSLVYPPLGALLGPRVLGALAAVAAATLFALLARRRYGDRAAIGVAWFGAATATNLVTGRITFALGLAVGLGSLLALQRGRAGWASAIAVLTSFASPVAGLFLAFAAAVAAWIAPPGERRNGIVVAAAALASLVALSHAFPTSGWFPFAFSAYLPVPLLVAAVLLLVPREERWLRHGAVAYGVMCTAFWLVQTPVGANAARLGSMFGGPLLALVLVRRRPVALALVAVPLVYWQWVAPVRDYVDQAGDPAVERSYFEPLLAELGRVVHGPVRIEIPPTHDRWEADYVAPAYPLARGWLRQIEAPDIDLFTGGNLTAASYRRWLDQRAVSYVAVADAKLDYIGADEAELVNRGLPYLRRVWRNPNWSLYRVRRPTPLLAPARARLTHVGPADFSLTAGRPGSYRLRIHYTPYWQVTAGDACVSRAGGDWTRVVAKRSGPISVAARLGIDGLLDHPTSSCSA
jgi:hypothetical protein